MEATRERESSSEDEAGSTEEEREESEEENEGEGEEEEVSGEDVSVSVENEGNKDEEYLEIDENEGEDDEKDELFEKLKLKEFPDKLKSVVFKCCGHFVEEEKRNEFLHQMEGELKLSEAEYKKSSDACIQGLKKLISAGREGIKAMAFAIETVKDVIERVRKLRKFKKEALALEPRVEDLKKRFMEIELDYYEEDFEENLESLFQEMSVLKDDFDDLLRRVKNFRLSVKVRWRLAIAFMAGTIGTGIVLFVGGAFTTILGAGCFITTLLTEGLALPVALTLYGLSILGMFSGVAICGIVMLSSFLVIGSALVQHLSCKLSLKKAKKVAKKIKGFKAEKWWGTMEKMMGEIKDAEKSKADVMKDVEKFVRKYQDDFIRPNREKKGDEDEESEEEEEEEEGREKRRKRKKKKDEEKEESEGEDDDDEDSDSD